MTKSTPSKDVHLHKCGEPFTLDRELLAARSAKLANLLKQNPQEDLPHLLKDIPADPKTLELVARFCHGFEANISTENAIRVACLANYLGMSETHSTNNLLKKALTFIEQNIIPSWNKSVRALKTTENILQQAAKLGLIDTCVESVIKMALENPRLLGEPIKNLSYDDDDDDENENVYRANVRRNLFVHDWKSEDLTTLSIQLYEPIICAMIQRQVPSEYITASLYQYAKNWVFSGGADVSIYQKKSQREAIEAVERLLPHDRGVLPCKLLFEMLLSAIELEASPKCRNGFEVRIGKQLDQATAKDLLIPSQGYAKEEQYDTECVRRILKNFFSNYTGLDASGIITVAELFEDFLAEVANDIDLKVSPFVSLVDMSIATSKGTNRYSDGVYRAIDIYLDKHRYLTESEKERVCHMLDCYRLSPEAYEHAAQNERLPLRVAVQVLFVGQLQLRDTIVQRSGDRLRLLEELEEEKEEEGEREVGNGDSEEVKREMEKMSSKAMELEIECDMMRREIQSNCCNGVKKEKVSMWKEMKRKFGCTSSMHDSNCHVKKNKVHPS